ncbi:AAA family ATPase [Asanoa sp. NPDC050611]|uniref:AAA family ATPase n=1 Tax=Asanoa sp. NPDC050611 TaxID=3157098 RepID=UPI0033E33765
MALLTSEDAIPHRPRRVLVAGTSGSGKTTVARRIAATLRLPHIEIDALFHGPDWTPLPSFENEVDRFREREEWVTEWQYSKVRARLAERADLMVWLDLPRAQVMRQLVRRTVARRIRREKLWNGNVEPPLWTLCTDPDHILRWAWRTHGDTATRMAQLPPNLPVVRLRSRRQVAAWLAGPLRRCPP